MYGKDVHPDLAYNLNPYTQRALAGRKSADTNDTCNGISRHVGINLLSYR